MVGKAFAYVLAIISPSRYSFDIPCITESAHSCANCRFSAAPSIILILRTVHLLPAPRARRIRAHAHFPARHITPRRLRPVDRLSARRAVKPRRPVGSVKRHPFLHACPPSFKSFLIVGCTYCLKIRTIRFCHAVRSDFTSVHGSSSPSLLSSAHSHTRCSASGTQVSRS